MLEQYMLNYYKQKLKHLQSLKATKKNVAEIKDIEERIEVIENEMQ